MRTTLPEGPLNPRWRPMTEKSTHGGPPHLAITEVDPDLLTSPGADKAVPEMTTASPQEASQRIEIPTTTARQELTECVVIPQ